MFRLVASVLVATLVAGACASSPNPDGLTRPTDAVSSTVDSVASTEASVASTQTTLATTQGSTAPNDPGPVRLVVDEVFPHASDAFTQGLAVRDGLIYESTGQYGQSSVRIVEPATGDVLRSRDLPSRYFGEGLELVGDRIIQLTWLEETAFIWHVDTLEPLGTFEYEGEGWGLCAMDGRFFMSDGSSQLTIRALDTFEALGTIDVRFEGEPVENLNELECTPSGIHANVWKTDVIVVIHPESGEVTSRIDAAELTGRLSSTDGIDVLNGIAYDPASDSFYLTGKYWPDMFRVRLVADG